MTQKDLPVVVIAGPTASGKTAAALEIATAINGEIICADSRTIYKGMDIGAAKPTPAEQTIVPHHLLDVVSLDETFTAADFQQAARAAITGIRSRGKLPVVVGGTGLYIDALIYDYTFRPIDEARRSQLNKMPLDKLQQMVISQEAALNDSDFKNRRRLIRVLESGRESSKKTQQVYSNVLYFGLNPSKETLTMRIKQRTTEWVDRGLIEEVKQLKADYGAAEPLNTSPYREIGDFLEGITEIDEAINLINTHLRQLARRQLTWLKRNPDIEWAESSEAILKLALASFREV